MPGLTEGKIYTVSEAEISPMRKILHYELSEIGWPFMYGAHHFIPLSEIDETEIFKERFNELVKQ